MNSDNAIYNPATDQPETILDKSYSPNKAERRIRRRLYDRFNYMKGDTLRVEAEQDWEDGDLMFGQYIPPPDSEDWRAHLVLPDAFAAIQAQMQESIDRNSRPYLRRVEDSDKGVEAFQNAILTYNLNRTGFDYQYFLAKYSAAIRGTAYLMEYYRVDKREIQDPTDVNDDGTLKYTKKEVTDYDDAYTEWVPNEFIYLDPAARDIDTARDMVYRDIMDVDEFKRSYGFRKDFINIDLVKRGGDTSTKSFFQMPHDMTENDVEILHWHNRATDEYNVAANGVVVRMGPLPTKHKELPVTPIYHYTVPGRMYGMGIPKVVKALSEERASIRNLNLDRQKMQINKMFLVNDQMDFDDEDLITRPHGFVEVSTNGLSIRDAIQPLEYGDVPSSYFNTENILLEDIRRATGIDDRIEGVSSGGTATEAQILQEMSQKRIGLISRITEMDAIKRVGKLKWSNIQFFYPTPRVERITEDNEERDNKVFRKISVNGQEFSIVKDKTTGKTKLQLNDVEGTTSFKLDKAMARYMDGDYDVVIDAESVSVVSKAIQQAKITEMFTAIAAIPAFLMELDPRKALTQILETNDQMPKDWLRGNGKTDDEMRQLADWENVAMSQGAVLSPTDGANTAHTEEHLNYTKTVEYQGLDDAKKTAIMQHIVGEHDANPATGTAASVMGGAPPSPGLTGTPPGQQAAPEPMPGVGMTPSTVTGEAPNSSANQGIGPIG